MIKIIKDKISRAELEIAAKEIFGNMVKCVADLKREIIAIGGELHADEEAELLHEGSEQKNLWGFNIYIDKSANEAIQYDSMINIRPSENNFSRTIMNEDIRKQIAAIAHKIIQDL